MPYVTEEIWQNIPVKSRESVSFGDPPGREEGNQASEPVGCPRPSSERESIVIACYPGRLPRDKKAEEEMLVIMETVTGVRTIRGELNLSPSLELKVSVRTLSEKTNKILKKNLTYLKKLAKADVIDIGGNAVKPKGSAAAVRKHVEVYVPLEGLLNTDLEIDRLSKEEAKLDQTILFLNKKLLNEDFLGRAPKDVVEKEKEKYEECLRKKERIQENIRKLYEAGGKA
jgi:valyl-tRNA synthetase